MLVEKPLHVLKLLGAGPFTGKPTATCPHSTLLLFFPAQFGAKP
jgi:hypothetical protein